MFDDRFVQFSNGMEKCIRWLVVMSIISLILVQMMLQYDPLRYFFSPVEQMEGKLVDVDPPKTVPSWLEQR
jgi:hypothetical protein